MKVFTAHERPDEMRLLLREGFSWGAFLFGFLYLAVHGAWVAAALNLAALVAVAGLVVATGSMAPLLGLAVLQGMFALDLRRWSLARRGFAEGPVVAAADADQALLRLMTQREAPDAG
jgi:hypothetical protein